MWLGVLGLIVCLLVGTGTSLLASHLFSVHPTNECDHLDPDLFVPPVAKYLRKKQALRGTQLSEEDKSHKVIKDLFLLHY